jgi:gamma-glutamylcysteine synthetase
VRCVHRVGVENEKFGFQLDTLKPMTLDNIHDLLEGMASRFGHKRIMEDGTIAGLEKVHLSLKFRSTRALCRNGSIFRLTLIV